VRQFLVDSAAAKGGALRGHRDALTTLSPACGADLARHIFRRWLPQVTRCCLSFSLIDHDLWLK
jgi:hypothetical protein